MGVCADAPGASHPLDTVGRGRSVPLAGSRLTLPMWDRAIDLIGQFRPASAHGSFPAIACSGRGPRSHCLAGDSDREKRSLRHRGSGPLVDLGRAGNGAALAKSAAPRPGIDRMLRAAAWGGFASMALVYGTWLWLVAPRSTAAAVEWAFYESIGRGSPHDVARPFSMMTGIGLPYECRHFGSVPHDLAIRLFYLGRPACWHRGLARCLIRRSRRPAATPTAPGRGFEEARLWGRGPRA